MSRLLGAISQAMPVVMPDVFTKVGIKNIKWGTQRYLFGGQHSIRADFRRALCHNIFSCKVGQDVNPCCAARSARRGFQPQLVIRPHGGVFLTAWAFGTQKCTEISCGRVEG